VIDTHSHILPALDDGACDFSQSLAFMRLAASQGVEAVFATPHTCDGVYNCTKDQILSACRYLTAFLEEQGVETSVLPGAEVRVNHDLVMEYDRGDLLTLNNGGTHLLIELPALFMGHAISQMIRQLRDRGITPVIAHAERNPMILTKPELVADFTYNGAVIQITAGSLLGDFGKHSLKAVKKMIGMGQVFCLGSDIHPGRKYRMADAKKRLIKLIGKRETQMITRENPGELLHNIDSSNISTTGLFKETCIS
jgi:protein-tyrosine phosphatase